MNIAKQDVAKIKMEIRFQIRLVVAGSVFLSYTLEKLWGKW